MLAWAFCILCDTDLLDHFLFLCGLLCVIGLWLSTTITCCWLNYYTTTPSPIPVCSPYIIYTRLLLVVVVLGCRLCNLYCYWLMCVTDFCGPLWCDCCCVCSCCHLFKVFCEYIPHPHTIRTLNGTVHKRWPNFPHCHWTKYVFPLDSIKLHTLLWIKLFDYRLLPVSKFARVPKCTVKIFKKEEAV